MAWHGNCFKSIQKINGKILTPNDVKNKKEILMKRKIFTLIAAVALGAALAGSASATTLTFDNPVTPGIALGGSMTWNNTGGGHLYNEQFYDNDFIYFAAPTTVNSFQMNEMPWQGYTSYNFTANISMEAYDSLSNLLWSSTVDLLPYSAWTNWLTVNVNTANVSMLKFIAPGTTPDDTNGFWPSIDNMVINQSAPTPTPEPSTLILLGAGIAGLGIMRRYRKAR